MISLVLVCEGVPSVCEQTGVGLEDQKLGGSPIMEEMLAHPILRLLRTLLCIYSASS